MSTPYVNRKPWPKKLLVEGKDDLFVIANIRDGRLLTDNFDIVDCEGVENVADKLLAYIKNKQLTVGVVVDADDQLNSRWESLRNVLIEQEYIVPKQPDPNGTIIPPVGRSPKIGIWLMPDNIQEPGMLEHFVSTLIPPGDKLKPIAEDVITRLQADGLNRYKSIQASKALIHTWLAWQEDPGTPMGLAITKTYLDHNTELCQRFANWLDSLYNQ